MSVVVLVSLSSAFWYFDSGPPYISILTFPKRRYDYVFSDGL